MDSSISDPAVIDRRPFFGLMPEAFDEWVVQWGWPVFRGRQVRDWVYGKLIADPRLMTNLSARDRDWLGDRVEFARAQIARGQSSADGTRKLLLTWNTAGTGSAAAPGLPLFASTPSSPARVASAETVMIPDGQRRTACVSSQVGCPVGCRFCASGIGAVKGNLSAAQIVEQVFQLNQLIDPPNTDTSRPRAGGASREGGRASRITNVVFMGMGEPLANYAQVMQAIRILHDPNCFNLGARKITISTVGVPSRIRDLARENLPLNLALSLHAPNERLRRELIPWAEHFSLDEILGACRFYFDRTGREITLEYILLSGVNDRPEHARELATLSRTVRANVNLIRYNEVDGLPYQRPHSEDVMVFQNVLRANGVNAHVRKSRGRDIDAACGQLRRKQEAQEQEMQLTSAASPAEPTPGLGV